MDSEDDPYQILGVSRDATTSQIKSAYRKLALKHHPDKQQSEEMKQLAGEKFAKISNAYEILGDSQRRQEYDTTQQEGQSRHNHFDRQQYHYNPHAFHDPFQVFERVFAEEFGAYNRGSRRVSPFEDPFFQQPAGFGMFGHVFGRDPFMNDPFFGDPSRGFGGGALGGQNDVFSQMQQQMNMMRQQQMDMGRQSQGFDQNYHPRVANNGFSTFSSSSFSSSSFGTGGNRESVSTSTRIINGKRQTVTERTITKPDGTVERHVETSGDDDFPEQYRLQQQGGGGEDYSNQIENGNRGGDDNRRSRY